MIKKAFSPHTLKWWQVGIFKISMFAFGVLVGAYWHEFFAGWTMALLVIFIVGWIYLATIWFKD